jgi:transposase
VRIRLEASEATSKLQYSTLRYVFAATLYSRFFKPSDFHPRREGGRNDNPQRGLAKKRELGSTAQMISEKERAQIIQALKANPNGLAVAKQFGVSSSAVYKLTRTANLPLKMGGKAKLPAEKRARILEALKNNPNGLAVAEQYGVSSGVIYRVAKKAGIAVGGHKLSPEKEREILEALKDNPSGWAVVRRCGVNKETVAKLAKRGNIVLRGVGGRRGVLAEKRTQVIEALKNNPHGLTVAKQFGVSYRVIYGIAKEAKIALGREEKAKWVVEKTPEIIAALKGNPNAAAVARQFDGVSAKAVARLAKNANIELVNARKMREKRRAQIIRALQANPNGLAVAKQFGVNSGVVYSVAKGAKIAVSGGEGPRCGAGTQAEIIKALKANPNACQVARQLGGVSHWVVRGIAKKANIALGGRRKS